MDIRKVKKLIELLEESGIAEIEIHEGEESVRISRYSTNAPAPVQQYAPAPMAAPMAPPDAGHPAQVGSRLGHLRSGIHVPASRRQTLCQDRRRPARRNADPRPRGGCDPAIGTGTARCALSRRDRDHAADRYSHRAGPVRGGPAGARRSGPQDAADHPRRASRSTSS